MVSPAKTMISVPATLTYTAEAKASDSESQKNGRLIGDKEMEMEKEKCLSGFIFLCNQSTKLECYRYRVFGLPLGQKKMVEEIKPGMKLFLFDFEVKLLYGVYEATSAGILNLEPAAFGGKFPAQVQFSIFKECLPIPESSLKYVIKENYKGRKFKQELTGEQVTKLISSFRPLAASSWPPASQALPNVSLPRAMPPSVMENQIKLTGRLPVMEVPHLAGVQYSHIRPLVNPHYLEHGSHRRATYVENAYPTLDHRSLPAASSYYTAHPQRPLFAEDVARGGQVQYSSRYRAAETGSTHAQITSLERYTTMEQRAPHEGVTISGRQYQQLPQQREALYQDNVAAYNSYSIATDKYAYDSNSTATEQYTPSAAQTHLYASYQQLPLQGRQCQDSIAAYSSNPAAPAQHTTSDSQQQIPAAYFPLHNEASHQDNASAFHSNLVAIAQYVSSVQQQVHVPHDQSLRGTQYQDSVDAYSSNPAAPAQYTPSVLQQQVQGTYLHPQRDASYQEYAAPYNPNPVPAQCTSITQPRVGGVNVAAYNANPIAVPQYNPSDGSSYFPYSATDHHTSH